MTINIQGQLDIVKVQLNMAKTNKEIQRAFGNLSHINNFRKTLIATGHDAKVVNSILNSLANKLVLRHSKIGVRQVQKGFRDLSGTLREVDRLVDSVFNEGISTTQATRSIKKLAESLAGPKASAYQTKEAVESLGEYFDKQLIKKVQEANRELQKFSNEEAKRAELEKRRNKEREKAAFKTEVRIRQERQKVLAKQKPSGLVDIITGKIPDHTVGQGPIATYDREQEVRRIKAQGAYQRELAKETNRVTQEQKRLNQFLDRANDLRKEGNLTLNRDQEKIIRRAKEFAVADPTTVAKKRLVGDDLGISSKEVESIANSTKKLNKELTTLNANTLTLEKFGQAARLAFKRYAAFVVGSSAIFAITSNLRQATTAALELEHVFTKIQQVIGGSDKELKPLRDGIRSLSSDFGVSGQDLAEGVFFFAQSGIEDMKELEVIARNLAKIPLSATFDDINSTSEGLIAAFGQFNLTALDTGYVLDLVNEFAAKFAVESSDIFEAIKRGGSAFSVAGGDLEEFIGLFSVLRSATRESASTLGTFFKSGFAQILQGSSQQLLKQLGVQSQDLTTQLQELSNILFGDESQFSERRRIEIARQLTGERQFARLLALLRQLQDSDVQDQLQRAFEAAPGSLDDSLVNRLDDIGVSINRIRQTFINFVSEITENQAFKSFAKDIADLTQTLFGLLSVIQPLIPFLTILGGFKLSQGFAKFTRGALPNGIFGGITGRSVRDRFKETNNLSDLRQQRINAVIAERRRRSLVSGVRNTNFKLAGGAAAVAGVTALSGPDGISGNIASAATSGLFGGVIGAQVGSAIPGIGTAVGAVIGTLIGVITSVNKIIQKEAERRLSNDIKLAVRTRDSSKVISTVAQQSLSQALRTAQLESAYTLTGMGYGGGGGGGDRSQLNNSTRNRASSLAVSNLVKNIENDGLGGEEFLTSIKKTLSESANSDEFKKKLSKALGDGFSEADVSNLVQSLEELKLLEVTFKDFVTNFGRVNNKFIEFGNRFEIASRFVTDRLYKLDTNIANITQGFSSVITDPSSFIQASAGNKDQILSNAGLGSFNSFIDSSVELFNAFISENKTLLKSFSSARLGTEYEAFEDDLNSAEGFFRALTAVEAGGIEKISELQNAQIQDLVRRFGEGFDKVFALGGAGFDIAKLFNDLLANSDTRAVIEGMLPSEVFDRVAQTISGIIDSFNLELQKRTELVQSLNGISEAIDQARTNIIQIGAERSLRLLANSLSTDVVGDILKEVNIQQGVANSFDVSSLPRLLGEISRLTVSRNAANAAAAAANAGGAGLDDLAVIQKAQDINEDYISTQSRLNSVASFLTEKLSAAAQVSDLLTKAFKTYQDQIRSAGSAVLSFSTEELSKAFSAFDAFVGLARSGGGIGTASGINNALNNITKEQFDRVNQILSAVGSFNLGGISGSDIIGNIQEQIAIPFLARARSAITGESQQDAAKAITTTLEELRNSQEAAVKAEDELRRLQQSIVQNQVVNLQEDAKLIQSQFAVVQELSRVAVVQERAAQAIINALGSNFNGNNTPIPGLNAAPNIDSLLTQLNTGVDSLTGLTSTLASSLETLTSGGIKTETQFTVSPIQVNVALSVPDVLNVVGPAVRREILREIGDKLSVVFQDDQEKLSLITQLGQ